MAKRAMMIPTPTILVWILLTAPMAGQPVLTNGLAELLPSDARIIETASVPVRAAKTRLLVLWMKAPRRVNSRWDSAADFLYGDHWLGPTFLSLIDPSSARLINTVTIQRDPEWSDDRGELAIPFFTYDGFYYVPNPDKERKGKPLLLHLRDLTGEGINGQFVLFDHVASGIAAGSVIGYSPRSDTAVQYAVERTPNRFRPVVHLWAVQVFHEEPLRAGYWKFTWEAGHGAMGLTDEELHFDAARQLFVEKSTTRPYPGLAQVHCELNAASLPNFLERMQSLAPYGSKNAWLQSLIGKSPPNNIGATEILPVFHGTEESLTLAFQASTGGAIAIEFTTESQFAAALRVHLQRWCAAN